MNKYHFSFYVAFKQDYPLMNISKILQKTPQKVVDFKDAKKIVGVEKTARISFRSETFLGISTDEDFANYVDEFFPYFEELKKILQQESGEC